ncbi:MAG: biotin/lipoyl-binding protein [Myxococcota bacterium]|nr:biotin/lipoyl-binding protein [Myxococcota bacterium]
MIRNSLKKNTGPWVLWLVTAVIAGWLYSDMHHVNRVVGFAATVDYRVSPTETGRLTSVAVEVGQPVSEGQVLATVDSAEIEDQLAVLEAERSRAEARYHADRSRAMYDAMEQETDMASSVARTERRLAESRTEYLEATAELEVHRAETTRVRRLVSQKMVDRGQLAAIEARVASLRGKVDGSRSTLELLERQLQASKERLSQTTEERVAELVAPRKREVEVIDARLQAMRSRKDGLILRSPVSGHVATVHRQVGAVAGPDMPVATVIAPAEGRVVACIAEEQALDVPVGAVATVWPRTDPDNPTTGRVVGLGPIVEKVPSRCRPNLGSRAWGRDVMILLDEPAALLPGQAVEVEVAQVPSGSRGAHALDIKRKVAGEPQEMTVPQALLRRTRLEPSGAVWVPALLRYVLVSDDTGHRGVDEHAPWLFTMDTRGQVDPTPLAITGIDSVSDMEAIAPREGGGVYVLCSQSLSRRGARPEARQLFLRLKPSLAGFEVDGSVHLASMLEELSDEVRRDLGIPDLTKLDIEALAPWGESLLFGLKSPGSRDGDAIVWKLGSPDVLFEGGTLEAAGLTRWGQISLPVQVGDQTVPGGISDLLTLPDGSLAITATAVVDDKGAQAGGLWWVPKPSGGELEGRPIRSFAGLKPEGLSLSPSPGKLLITFDTGSATPLWVELDRPAP